MLIAGTAFHLPDQVMTAAGRGRRMRIYMPDQIRDCGGARAVTCSLQVHILKIDKLDAMDVER